MITDRLYHIQNQFVNLADSAEFQTILHKLQDLGIDVVQLAPQIAMRGYYVFHVVEESSCFSEIIEWIDRAKKIEGTDIKILYSIKFTEEELSKADFLEIRSVYAGITPLDAFRSSYIRMEHECDIGYAGQMEHFVQVGPPVIRKFPSWRQNRHFASDYDSAMTYLFCSSHAKQIIEESGLTGAEFNPVIDARTKQPAKDVWQIHPQECDDFMLPGPFLTAFRPCKICGKMRHVNTDGRYLPILSRSLIPLSVDFMQTPPLVGADIGYPFYVITGKAYRVLKKANMTRGLAFSALEVQ